MYGGVQIDAELMLGEHIKKSAHKALATATILLKIMANMNGTKQARRKFICSAAETESSAKQMSSSQATSFLEKMIREDGGPGVKRCVCRKQGKENSFLVQVLTGNENFPIFLCRFHTTNRSGVQRMAKHKR